MTEVKVPELTSGVINAVISMWHFTAGDSVRKDEDLVEMVTDKATFNLPSPITGTVKEVLAGEGEAVKEGDIIALIQE